MSPPHRKGLALLLLSVWLLGSDCGNDGGTDVEVGADFVGNWVSTSFVLDGEELMTAGSSFYISIGFFSDGSYQLIAGGDEDGVICTGSTSCNESGDFSYTGTYITLDPGTMDELVFEYSVSGSTLTIEGDSSLGPYTAVFEKT
ncbi:MAG: hypothetical protein PVJ80_03770 [Gemmatimonadota bacterium]|jgi:hypothetical protein